MTPWGKPAMGLKTRKKKKHSNKLIVRRRDGKAIKVNFNKIIRRFEPMARSLKKDHSLMKAFLKR